MPTVPHKICPLCKHAHDMPGIYCSRSCANTRVHTNATRIAIAATLKGKVNAMKGQEFPYTRISQCTICGKFFGCMKNKRVPSTCSPECKQLSLSRAGKKSAASRITRSVDEIALYNLCASHFTHVTHNEPIFNGWDADIIIHDVNIAILWNGPWHYQHMVGLKHSLDQVRNRDRIKLQEIAKLGWTALVFEDRSWSVQDAFNHIVDLVAAVGIEPTFEEAYETSELP